MKEIKLISSLWVFRWHFRSTQFWPAAVGSTLAGFSACLHGKKTKKQNTLYNLQHWPLIHLRCHCCLGLVWHYGRIHFTQTSVTCCLSGTTATPPEFTMIYMNLRCQNLKKLQVRTNISINYGFNHMLSQIILQGPMQISSLLVFQSIWLQISASVFDVDGILHNQIHS